MLTDGPFRLRFCIIAWIPLILSASGRAQLTFTQANTTVVADNEVYGVAFSPINSALYVATSSGNVQPYDLSLTPAGVSFSDLGGTQFYMNLGAPGIVTFSNDGFLRDMDVEESIPVGAGFGPTRATSFSRQISFSGETHLVFYDSNLSTVRLYNRTANSYSTIFTLAASGLADIAAVDFGYTGSSISGSFFFAATSAGYVAEYSLSGVPTGSTGNLNLISGGALTAFSYNDGQLLYASYNQNIGDFGTSRVDFGTFTGTAIPEPSTYGLLAGMIALGLAAWRGQRAG